jgi:hypothetical protein
MIPAVMHILARRIRRGLALDGCIASAAEPGMSCRTGYVLHGGRQGCPMLCALALFAHKIRDLRVWLAQVV